MKPDLRYIKTEENLRNSLLELLQEQPYGKISVTTICSKAKCSRNAFYQHYESKENLHQSIITDILVDIESSCRPVTTSLTNISREESQIYLGNILTAVEKHRNVLTQLLSNQQNDFSILFKKMMIDAILTNAHTNQQETRLDYIHYFASGIAGFIQYWITQTNDSLEKAVTALCDIAITPPKLPED